MSTVPKKQKKRRGKRLLKFLGILAGGIIAFFFGSNWLVLHAGSGHIFEDASQLPHHRVGIVLGCSPRFAFFTGRMDAAAQLYREGKVERLLVTGDNMNQGYNEPAEMMKALVKRGIPKEHITADYAGFRTLDSMVRAHEVFGLTEGTVITDDFHLARSIYYAQHAGLEVDGFGSVAAENSNSKQVELREILARGRAVIDILIDKQPKFLGKRESFRSPSEHGASNVYSQLRQGLSLLRVNKDIHAEPTENDSTSQDPAVFWRNRRSRNSLELRWYAIGRKLLGTVFVCSNGHQY